MKLVPVIVTAVPPASGPSLGEMELTVGTARYVNSSAAARRSTFRPSCVTVTSTAPEPAGLFAISSVEDLNSTAAAALDPNLTSLAFVKLAPLICHRRSAAVRAFAGGERGDGGERRGR